MSKIRWYPIFPKIKCPCEHSDVKRNRKKMGRQLILQNVHLSLNSFGGMGCSILWGVWESTFPCMGKYCSVIGWVISQANFEGVGRILFWVSKALDETHPLSFSLSP